MKYYENLTNDKYLMKGLPVLVRLDGRAFHSFTRGLQKPYDYDLIKLMIDCTKFMCLETNAIIGYTQSDEISLLLYSTNFDSQLFFDSKISKINSIASSLLSVYFNKILGNYLPQKLNCDNSSFHVFDCRCWTVPNKNEAVNYFVWREQDAVRNSIQSAGQFWFSHKQLEGKSCDEIQEMLFSTKGINWNDFPSSSKRGTYIKKIVSEKTYTPEELSKLPLQHEARNNPDFKFIRSSYEEVENVPILTKIENREGFIFGDTM